MYHSPSRKILHQRRPVRSRTRKTTGFERGEDASLKTYSGQECPPTPQSLRVPELGTVARTRVVLYAHFPALQRQTLQLAFHVPRSRNYQGLPPADRLTLAYLNDPRARDARIWIPVLRGPLRNSMCSQRRGRFLQDPQDRT